MSERFVQTVRQNLSDFGNQLVESGVASPWDGLVQICDKVPGVNLPEWKLQGAKHADSLGAKAGEMAGFIADFALLSMATKAACGPLYDAAGLSERGGIASATSMGVAGGLYGGVFTPTYGTKDLLGARLKQAGVQAGTFATMGLASGALGGGFEGSLARRIGANAVGGGFGGTANALLNERLMHNRWATGAEIAQQAGTFAVFGAGFGALDYAMGNVAEFSRRGTQPPAPGDTVVRPFERLSQQPILGPREGHFDAAGAFNPTATRLPNGNIAILYRAQDGSGVSTVGYAEAAPNGVDIVKREPDPVLAPRVENEKLGIEDPRLTADSANPSQWELTATKWDGKDAQLADWTSSDLKNWQERGIMMPANEGTWNTQWTKSGSIVSQEVDGKLVPVKINGKYWMYYMGNSEGVVANTGSEPQYGRIDQMGLASSEDGIHWVDATNKPILPGRPGQFDSNVVEPGPAAVVTNRGIALIYSGGSPYEGNNGMFKYQTGVALFSKNDPTRLLYRSSEPVFKPETPWEIENSSSTVHQVPNVVFPQGLVPDGKGGYLVYYGAADSYTGVARMQFTPFRPEVKSVVGPNIGQVVVQSPASLTLDNHRETISGATRNGDGTDRRSHSQ